MPDIFSLRSRMDRVTLELIRLLKERIDIAGELGRIKMEENMEILDKKREADLKLRVISLCRDINLDESIAVRFLNMLISESVAVQLAGMPTHLSIFRKAKTLESEGAPMIHMEVGDPDFAPPGLVRDALVEAFDAGLVRYGQAEGMGTFRTALAVHSSERFNARVHEDQVLVSPGARFSIFLAISTLLRAGDEIIIIEPAWPAYGEAALNAGVSIKRIHTTLEDGWEPRLDDIRNAISPASRMIVLNYPNNPTGKILPPHIQEGILALAEEHDLYVISDEIYSEYAYTNWKSLLEYGYAKGIVAQSFSKSHAMAGFRIGYAIADRGIIKKMTRLQALSLTNVAESIQHAAMRALEAETAGNSELVRRRLDLLSSRAAKMGLEFLRPNGAMYLFARVPDGTILANTLLEYGVAVAPGEGFGRYRDFIRISVTADEKKLIKGMDMLEQVLNE